jgi:branched-chain amino acid transport system ATP-binding protein
MPLLEVRNMTHFFGGLRAVHNYNLTFESGEIRGLIGPNGAGKTTIFNLLTGIYTPTEGEINFLGKNIKGVKPHEIAAAGIARTFQNLRLWRHVSVLDHVKLACYSKIDYGLAGALFGTGYRHRQEKEFTDKAYGLLEMFGISQFAGNIVTGLPYGVQRRVEMARAMAIDPKILFLDEPTAGMTPDELNEMVAIIRKLREELGLTIFLIEHRMKVVMDLCEQIQTLVFGEVIAEGNSEQIMNNPQVIEAYLGKEVVI